MGTEPAHHAFLRTARMHAMRHTGSTTTTGLRDLIKISRHAPRTEAAAAGRRPRRGRQIPFMPPPHSPILGGMKGVNEHSISTSSHVGTAGTGHDGELTSRHKSYSWVGGAGAREGSSGGRWRYDSPHALPTRSAHRHRWHDGVFVKGLLYLLLNYVCMVADATRLVSIASGTARCLAATASKTSTELAECASADSPTAPRQRWELRSDHTILNSWANKCLDGNKGHQHAYLYSGGCPTTNPITSGGGQYFTWKNNEIAFEHRATGFAAKTCLNGKTLQLEQCDVVGKTAGVQ
eukprot:COSAG01_NODE_10935_length_2045_cov_137.567831_2_plen_293_part_00